MRRRITYYIFAVQIGASETVLMVNYCKNIQKTFREFIRKHPQIKNSKLRPDLYEGLPECNPKNVTHRCSAFITDLEREGYEVIAGATLTKDYWSLYVIEIEGDTRHVYVGQTNYPIELRLQQHIYKYNPARYLLKVDNFSLVEELCAGLPVFRNKEAALEGERKLAEELRARGYKVEGGH